MSLQSLFEFSTFKSPESPLLILKEALNVIHNEIKREKNSLASLFPPSSPLSLPFSPDYMDVPGRGREQAEKEQWRESQWMRRGQWENEKYRQRRQSMNPFHPRCICAAPRTIIEVWEHYCFDGWLGLYRPTLELALGTRGQEAESKEWFVHMCAFTVLCVMM